MKYTKKDFKKLLKNTLEFYDNTTKKDRPIKYNLIVRLVKSHLKRGF